MLPALTAGAAGPLLAGAAGPLLGAGLDSSLINQGMGDYRNYTNAGSDVLRQGAQQAQGGYAPYTAAGAGGISGAAQGIAGRTQAQGPTLSATNPNDVSQYLNPSIDYSTNQANRQIMATGLAGGAVGGGLAKALSNNANQMAQTNWNQAYQQMLNTNAQNFGQQQQQYQNNTDFQQNQIQNGLQLGGLGLQAAGGLANNQLAYNQGINMNYGNIAANQQTGYNAMGSALGNGLSKGLSGIADIFGGL